MGRLSIIQKIEEVFEKGIKNEKDVFYVMAQLRKYFDSSKQTRNSKVINYPTFSLISDWILHSYLNGGGAKRQLLQIEQLFNSSNGDESFLFMTSFSLFKDLHTDLKKIFEKLKISISIIDNRTEWLNFVEYLVEILMDLPLINVNGGNVKSFRFNEGFIIDESSKQVSFTIYFADNHRKHFSIDLLLI